MNLLKVTDQQVGISSIHTVGTRSPARSASSFYLCPTPPAPTDHHQKSGDRSQAQDPPSSLEDGLAVEDPSSASEPLLPPPSAPTSQGMECGARSCDRKALRRQLPDNYGPPSGVPQLEAPVLAGSPAQEPGSWGRWRTQVRGQITSRTPARMRYPRAPKKTYQK